MKTARKALSLLILFCITATFLSGCKTKVPEYAEVMQIISEYEATNTARVETSGNEGVTTKEITGTTSDGLPYIGTRGNTADNSYNAFTMQIDCGDSVLINEHYLIKKDFVFIAQTRIYSDYTFELPVKFLVYYGNLYLIDEAAQVLTPIDDTNSGAYILNFFTSFDEIEKLYA